MCSLVLEYIILVGVYSRATKWHFGRHKLRTLLLLPFPLDVIAILILAMVCLIVWPVGLVVERIVDG